MYSHSTKITNRINKGHGGVNKLKSARGAKDDEFYTRYQDVINELNQYPPEVFDGKDIICPCDCDILEGKEVYSITIEFEDMEICGFHFNKVHKVRYSLFEEPLVPIEIDGDEADEFIRTQVKCSFLRYLRDVRGARIKSVTASGYDPATDRGVRFESVDYSKYDLCITNPPFSQLSTFMAIMIDQCDKRQDTDKPFNFIILAPMVNRANPNIGGYIMQHKAYLGFGRMLALTFEDPSSENKYKPKQVSVDWVTSFRYAQDEVDRRRLHTNVEYEVYKNDYPIMVDMTMKDGTHPIRVTKGSIPDDYYGWMFTSVAVLDILSYEEFEFYITQCHKLLNNTEHSPLAHKVSNAMYKDSKGNGGFGGVLFRRIPHSRDGYFIGTEDPTIKKEITTTD